MGQKKPEIKDWSEYYDQVDILDELLEEPIHFSLDDQLQKEILIHPLLDLNPPLAFRKNKK